MHVHPDHFAAYSFVDRIVSFEAGTSARAVFDIPPALASFPSCLVAEAVGQLAAWVAMDRIEFRGRPVAALATETVFRGDALPGERLVLEVELLACDDDVVAYNGRASVVTHADADRDTATDGHSGNMRRSGTKGRPIVELIDCLGPMLPVADFDSPDALRERLELLRSEGAVSGRFRGVDSFPLTTIEHRPGETLRARLDVPREATFFHDHFPRRAVFPATLLLDAQLRLALDCAAGSAALDGARPQPRRVTHVKMRSFIEPGQALDLAVELAALADQSPALDRTRSAASDAVAPAERDAARAPAGLRAMLSARTDGRVVATARVEIGAAETRSECAA